MPLAVEPDPPLAELASYPDPPLAKQGAAGAPLFDDEVFDTIADLFDPGMPAGNWFELGELGIASVTPFPDPPIASNRDRDYWALDFEPRDFLIGYDAFVTDADPPLVELLVEADPVPA